MSNLFHIGVFFFFLLWIFPTLKSAGLLSSPNQSTATDTGRGCCGTRTRTSPPFLFTVQLLCDDRLPMLLEDKAGMHLCIPLVCPASALLTRRALEGDESNRFNLYYPGRGWAHCCLANANPWISLLLSYLISP